MSGCHSTGQQGYRQARNRRSSIDDRQSRRAFTLIEMTVVIAIIILLAGLVVPAATQMWRERKIADSQNLVSGMLMTARARAIQSGGAETGLFFFIDDQGAQRVVPISQDPNDPAQTDQTRIIRGWQSDGRWYNVFTVVRGQSFTLPAPMRAAPTYVICPASDDGEGMCKDRDKAFEQFSNEELINSDFANVTVGTNADTAQAHRNFFTLIFAPSGEMLVGRNVIIRDVDDEAEPGVEEGEGTVTMLRVAAPANGLTEYFLAEDSNPKATFAGAGATRWDGTAAVGQPPNWLIVEKSDVAMNFPSVDGLLVYDDSLFNEAGDADARRAYLMDYGMPFYINRITGAVVRGPVGEVAQAGP